MTMNNVYIIQWSLWTSYLS